MTSCPHPLQNVNKISIAIPSSIYFEYEQGTHFPIFLQPLHVSTFIPGLKISIIRRSPWKINLNDEGSVLAVLEDTMLEIYQRDHFLVNNAYFHIFVFA